MRAVTGDAIDLGDAFVAELHPPGRTLRTHAATAVVMDHRAHAEPCLFRRHGGTDRSHDAAGLVTRDDRTLHGSAEAERGGAAARPVEFQIRSAHAGGAYLEHDLFRPCT